MAKQTRDYFPGDIVLTVGGVRIQEFAAGTGVSWTPGAPHGSITPGLDGHSGRNVSAQRHGEVKVTLLAGSPSNKTLQDLDRANAVFECTIKDLHGTEIYSCDASWIGEVPAAEFAEEMGSREWTILGNDWTVVQEGSYRAGQLFT